jgi:kynureninase
VVCENFPVTKNNFEHALAQAKARDAQDPLASKRALFHLPEGLIYLDGNSLGALPSSLPARMQQAVVSEWGNGLIRSWNDAGWYEATGRVGKQIAALIGAKANEVIACDSTSINLFKVLCAAAQALPERNIIICEEGNFPTSPRAQGVCMASKLYWQTKTTSRKKLRKLAISFAP